MIAAVVVLVAGVLAIGGLWWIGHPSVIDRGPSPGEHYPIWDDHSIGHLLGAMAVAWIVCGLWYAGAPEARDESRVVAGAAGFGVSMLLWTLVEVVQRFPRDKQGGYFSREDILVDFIGAATGVLVCAAW